MQTVLPENEAFFNFLANWYDNLRSFDLSAEMRSPGTTAIFVEDMVRGFCREGSLASDRVCALIDPIVRLLQRSHSLGVNKFVLVQDAHSPDAPEFEAFPPHCVTGTPEAETLPELMSLSFAKTFDVVPKNALNPGIDPILEEWLNRHPDLLDMIVVGDCTDLCTYQMAMHLRILANARNLQSRRVIVPANAVQTYDMSVPTAQSVGALPHPGDLFHLLFLYHMALNGIVVVRDVV